MKYVTSFIYCLLMFIIAEGQGTSNVDSVLKLKPLVVSANIYPNPATNKVEVLVNGFQPGILHLKIMDRNGILCRDDKRLLANGNEVIVVMFLLPPGIYFILLRQTEKMVKKKLLVQ